MAAVFNAPPSCQGASASANAVRARIVREFRLHLDRPADERGEFSCSPAWTTEYQVPDIGVRGGQGRPRQGHSCPSRLSVVSLPMFAGPRVEKPLRLALSRLGSEMNTGTRQPCRLRAPDC